MDASQPSLLQGLNPAKIAVVSVIFLLGWLISRVISRSLSRVAANHFDNHQAMLIKRASFYLLMAATLVTGLNEAGINLSVVVGAAGVVSVAIGFASQTSMSNLISGIFIVIEKPFMVGDTIKVGATTGEVAFIGLLSTILKTPDNIMVRIPNESLMKSEIYNITRYPTRRFELPVAVTYGADLGRVKEVLIQTARQSSHILQTPSPSVVFKEYTATSINLVLAVWAKADQLADAGFDLPVAVKAAFEKAEIDFATTQRPLSLTDAKALRVTYAEQPAPNAQ